MFELIMALVNLALGLYLISLGRGRPLPQMQRELSPERKAKVRKLCTVGGVAMLVLALLYLVTFFMAPEAQS
ncbi:hypothetical protein [Microbulbifer guangxiensis]|uniref:hypothetical protein n=1 Tax=Microbulbifer guangxiensis TaxID=2904249 RepID=UPI001F456B9D|nr:hypothetical protein [Microbulbifer guangxiensis]